jgi:hypothetical protein
MFDEPEEDKHDEVASEPAARAKEKSDEFRMHAELAAVFEGVRKFDAEIRPGLDVDIARDVQRTIAKLEKSKSADSPVLPEHSIEDAKRLLNLAREKALPTNDYHIHRRPGEVMIVRWLAGEQVEMYYQRLQAHFDAALEGYKEDERQAHEWKQDAEAKKYLAALDQIEVKMADRYLRDPIRQHGLFVVSTQTADEINIQYLAEHVMSVSPAELVGKASAPPGEPSEEDLAWFFKLFSLRGTVDDEERMCYFAFLQKTDENAW